MKVASYKDIAVYLGGLTAASVAASMVLSTGIGFMAGFRLQPIYYVFAIAVPMVAAPLLALPGVFAHLRLARMTVELERAASTDLQTGLPNRRAFFQRATALLAAAAHAPRPVAALMIDVDHFKDINDRYGHAAGDAALEMLAQAFRTALGEDGRTLLARVGGEEFAVLLDDAEAAEAALAAERLCASVRRLDLGRDGAAITISVSIGIALRPPGPDADNIDRLLSRADGALYRAKQRGRDRWEIADDTLADDTLADDTLADGAATAVRTATRTA